MNLLLVCLAAWMTGIAAYALIAGGLLRPDVLPALLIYGAFFSAIPAVLAFWLLLLPLFSRLRRRKTAPWKFVALGAGLCLAIAVAVNTLPRTASGPLSGEAARFYVVYALSGAVLGAGYVWRGRASMDRAGKSRRPG